MVLIGLTKLYLEKTKVEQNEQKELQNLVTKGEEMKIHGTDSSEQVQIPEKDLEDALYEENEVTVLAKQFTDEHPEYSVEVFEPT